MTDLPLPALIALAGLLAAFLLILGGKRLRHLLGLADAPTVDLDTRTLVSGRYGLAGRPDRLIREGGCVIPEEWKRSHRLRPWHIAQLGVYLLLVEENYGQKPPYGYVVCGKVWHRIENSDELRARVLGLAEAIRAARLCVSWPIAVSPKPGQCPPCSVRGHCGQARL